MKQQIADHIYYIPGRHGGGYPFCNSVYIEDEVRAVIDPASSRSELGELKNVRLAIFSHFHQDHIREVRALPDAEIAIHESEADALSDLKQVAKLIFFEDEDRAEIESWLSLQQQLVKVESWNFKVRRRLKDHDEISLGHTKIQVIHTPGHTIGHCCFWLPEPEILFSADIDLTDFGPWYGNACSNLGDFVNSLDKLKPYNPKVVITAHEAGVVKGEEFHAKLERYKGVIFTREQKILEALSSPKTLDEIVDLGAIYGDYLKQARDLRPIERRMVIHHLRWLEQKGIATFANGKWERI